MTRMKKVLLFIFLVFAALATVETWLLGYFPSVYWDKPWDAWVTDAYSGLPVEGAVVTANWESEMPTLEGSRPGDEVRIMETVTDANGHFSLPAWGPGLVKQGHVDRVRNPKIMLLRRGYEIRMLRNSGFGEADWNATRVTMKPVGTSTLERLQSWTDEYEYLMANPGECRWRLAPRTFAEFRRAQAVLSLPGVSPSEWNTPEQQLRKHGEYFRKAAGPDCPDPKRFLAEAK